MVIRVYKPTSPARRHMSVLTFEEVTKKAPEKSLTEVLKKNSGRNKQGKITVRHQGGGNKRKYRIIDFKRDKVDIPAKVSYVNTLNVYDILNADKLVMTVAAKESVEEVYA